MDPERKTLGELNYVRGFPVPAHPAFKENKTEQAMEFRANDGDVVLVAYPKTGSTWLQNIIWLIIHKGNPPFAVERVPRVEREGTESVEAMPRPRFYKYHLTFSHIRMSDKAKYVYIHRRPEDTFLSCYHFSKEMSNLDIDFGKFFELFVTGRIAFGNYFDHVVSAYEHRHEKNVLLVSYEKLNKDPRSGILEIAEFLGEDYLRALLADDELLLKDILERTSFEYMKRNFRYVKAVPGLSEKEINFCRKGGVGDGKRALNQEQWDRLQATVKEKLEDTEFVNLWAS